MVDQSDPAAAAQETKVLPAQLWGCDVGSASLWRDGDGAATDTQTLQRVAPDLPRVRVTARLLHRGRCPRSSPPQEFLMKYGIAFLLGVPLPVLAIVYIFSHC